MGMSTCVTLLRDGNDAEHKKKVAVLRACFEAKVQLPPEIEEYFEGSYIEDSPLVIEFKARTINGEECQGFEIDIDELPENVKTIRFCNSW